MKANILVLAVVFLSVIIDSKPVKKLTIAEYDAKEAMFLRQLNAKRLIKGINQFKPSRLLSNYAQREANHLANTSHLAYPKIDFLDNYFGYAFKIYGESDGHLVGKKICFNNLFTPIDTAIYDASMNCNPKQLDQDLGYQIGYGRALDADNNIYVVRIFRTIQSP